MKDNKYGEHNACDICFIQDIKEDKNNKLNENIKLLENLSNNIEESINKIKLIYEKINESKEELKLKVQKLFTKIRNALNDREDEILLKIDENMIIYILKKI